ncbi:hypothetical protein G7B40_009205 [Aetokthonos hydrillicola Thurmond2011]|jgi:hypothetical protein|uniref:Uncharacterized protein n=1 Tax=Aetokthonos hydrillicola Thurmond2011 TaxID=2712845 RepID=A0AAP5I4Y1_9CYAN|nr:hypothetical protein [Aetokthonos hydrillicola]MBO3457572.1 hypothetical protein [Aetokthonos hydrillicola CCALA 1050]MBW4590906.1 hypothetical protein [Aetokthonos hydrillicola CCALA 1050]MDR9894745.1 hypothetical protein [Aetokthonos hydrillicola Thurmond2011]
MNINLQIEQLIVEGVNLYPKERRLLQAIVEAELSQLLTSQGLPPHWRSSGTVPSVKLAAMEFPPNSTSVQMGKQIAQAVYQGMNVSTIS